MTENSSIGVVVLGLLVIFTGAYLYQRYAPVPSSPGIPNTGVTEQLPAGTAGNSSVYSIAQPDSQAEFDATETLYAKPNAPVGTTSKISGNILVDFDTPSLSQVDTITVDASTLQTDSSVRDEAISHLILRTDSPANRYITFSPNSLDGMPDIITDGVPFQFSLTGDLAISGVTRPATFTGTASIANDVLRGVAQATIKRSGYGLQIPSIPFVASVGDDIVIKILIVANKAS